MKKVFNFIGMSRMLKYLVIVVSVCIVMGAKAQTISNANPGLYGVEYNRLIIDSTILFPTRCGAPSSSAYLLITSKYQNRAAQVYDSCGHKWYGWDPATKVWSAIGYTDSAVFATVLRLVNDSTILANRINLKLNISDTAAMLSNRLKISDTVNMLSRSWLANRSADTATALQARIQTKLTKSDADTYYPAIQRLLDSMTAVQSRVQTKQPFGSYLIFSDSTTILAGRWLPNRATDTATALQLRIQTKQPLLGYTPISPSDTATMLSNRLKISDTATMLTPYARKSFGTQGSILFRGANNISKDNTRFYYDSTNQEVRFSNGNSNTYNLNLGGDSRFGVLSYNAHNKFRMTTYDSLGSGWRNFIASNLAWGTPTVPLPIGSGAILLDMVGVGYIGTPVLWKHGAEMKLMASENWDNSKSGSKIVFTTVKNGSNVQSESVVFNDNGSITDSIYTRQTTNHVLKNTVNGYHSFVRDGNFFGAGYRTTNVYYDSTKWYTDDSTRGSASFIQFSDTTQLTAASASSTPNLIAIVQTSLAGFEVFSPTTLRSVATGTSGDSILVKKLGVVKALPYSSIATGGTVTSVATTDGIGIISSVVNPATTANITHRVDTVAIATRAWRQKGIDSVMGQVGLKLNISDTLTMLSNRLKISDTATMLSNYNRKSDTLTMLSGYQRKNFGLLLQDTATAFSVRPLNNRFLDSISTIRTLSNSKYTGGTVTSVATNTGSGITGGTITSSGTISADTTVLSTKLNVLDRLNKYNGTSNTATVGILTSGSIASGFGSINNGSNSITGGASSFTTGAFTGLITNTVNASNTSQLTLGNSVSGTTKTHLGSFGDNTYFFNNYFFNGSQSYDDNTKVSNGILYTPGTVEVQFGAANTVPSTKVTFTNTAATFTISVTASSFIKSGGTSSQSLMADGSVQTVTSGTYTPTISNGANVASNNTVNDIIYTRVGNVVHLSFRVNIIPTASATQTAFTFAVPVGNATSVTGNDEGTSGEHGVCFGSTATTIQVSFTSVNTVGSTHYIMCDYLVY